jgi:chaperonin GroEL
MEKSGRPLLIVAEEIAPPVIMQLLVRREKSIFKIAAIHPPEFGHWRKAMLEDIAITTGGRVISVDLGGWLEKAELHDLDFARQVRISATKTLITAGGARSGEDRCAPRTGRAAIDAAPENIERDKFQERVAKPSGGTAMILPAERPRRAEAPEPADRGCDSMDGCRGQGLPRDLSSQRPIDCVS